MKKDSKRHPFTHLTEKQRDRLHALRKQFVSQKNCAEILGVSPSTICRELHRMTRGPWTYNSATADKDAETKREYSKRLGMTIDNNPSLRKYIIYHLKRFQSPDAIAGRMEQEGRRDRIGRCAIYDWIYHSTVGQHYAQYLCTRRTKPKSQSRISKRALIPQRVSHRMRPTDPQLIHTERDLFVSPTKIRKKPVGLLVVTPQSKLLAGHILLNKSSVVVMDGVTRVHQRQRVDTSLADNGIESVLHQQVSVPSYFCDPTVHGRNHM